ncbi:hypothetical protein TUM4438_10150 [Shewanella sairae]|uniref:Initiator Rep protein WH1 domain-containing protein n=1 Tax=Shewanella sairae TaxID=190310 RepID=A0ABQ4P5N3_9GAMM|nr:replication initiation protein [Shewanella sairae]MCL1130449.1 replication initiation protein [Shewanella sairae]GIU42785.1 hypothetical protein TUM4438_10150 [Shewanella sairae]
MNIESNHIVSSRNVRDIKKDFFKKSHELVFSQLSLSPIQHDVFALFLSRFEKENWDEYLQTGDLKDIPEYEFHSDLLSSWFKASKGHLSTLLKKPCQGLASSIVGIPSEDGDFRFIPLFSDIKYKKGMLSLVPNYKLLDAFIGASKGHSLIPHKEFRDLKLESSKRLYTILCRFKTHGKLHPQSLSQLYSLFGLVDESGKLKKKTYSVTGNFISRIIKPAIEEIDRLDPEIKFFVDATTDNYGFSYQKQGRKISGIEFLFEWKSNNSIGKVELNYDSAVNTYCELMDLKLLPSEVELNNLKNHLADVVLAGFDTGPDFIKLFKEAQEANKNMT